MEELTKKGSNEKMTSRDVAALTGTEHSKVMRKIKGIIDLLEDKEFTLANYGDTYYNDSQGKKQPEIVMTKSGSLFIASRYDVNLHLKVQQRWEALEESNKPTELQLAENYLAAVKAKIALEEKVETLNTSLDSLVGFASIIRVAKFNNIKETHFSWHKLKSKTKELVIKKAPSARYGYQNLYPVEAWRECYPKINVDFPRELPMIK